MNRLLIPLLAASALLSGCQHATVRHTVHLPVVFTEHRHVHNEVVIVHQHEGDHRVVHHHDHYETPHQVVTPPPIIHHEQVTVIVPPRHERGEGHDNRRDHDDRGQHGNPDARGRHPAPSTRPPQGRPHDLASLPPGRGHVGTPPSAPTPPPHAGRQPPAARPAAPVKPPRVVRAEPAQREGSRQVQERRQRPNQPTAATPKPVPKDQQKSRQQPPQKVDTKKGGKETENGKAKEADAEPEQKTRHANR